MERQNFIEGIGRDLGINASVNNVYGAPIHSGEKTIIPVARIAYGFGGGFGHGIKDRTPVAESDFFVEEQPSKGEGAGGGGGIYAKPKGVYEITPNATRFIPANSAKVLVAGVALGFLLKMIFFSGRRKK